MPVTVQTVLPVPAVLTRVASMVENTGFVAEDIFPVVRVDSERYAFFNFSGIGFKRYASSREVGAAYQRIDYSMAIRYGNCTERGLEHAIDDRIRNEAGPLEPDVHATQMLVTSLRLDQEHRVASLVTSTASYSPDLVAQPDPPWSNRSCNFHANILTAIEKVRSYIGISPNTILLPASVARAVSLCNDITDYVKNVVGLAAIERARPEAGYLLPKHIWGLRVIIAGAVENRANLQQSPDIRDVWGASAVIAYVPEKATKFAPAFGYIFRRSGPGISVERYRDEARSADVIRARTIQDERFVCTDKQGRTIAGFLFTNVLE